MASCPTWGNKVISFRLFLHRSYPLNMAFFIKIVTLFKLHRHYLLFLLLPSRLNLCVILGINKLFPITIILRLLRIFPTVVVLLNLLLLWYRLLPRIHPVDLFHIILHIIHLHPLMLLQTMSIHRIHPRL
ncbi:hypothetical protein C8R42DRAFT_666186 [Lentinula raphanica]|nr:hypothetical protein C8R42DRAFT_666186 [Lentinula raphanica]